MLGYALGKQLISKTVETGVRNFPEHQFFIFKKIIYHNKKSIFVRWRWVD